MNLRARATDDALSQASLPPSTESSMAPFARAAASVPSGDES